MQLARDTGKGKVLFSNIQQMFICSYSVSKNESCEVNIREEKEAKERKKNRERKASLKARE